MAANKTRPVCYRVMLDTKVSKRGRRVSRGLGGSEPPSTPLALLRDYLGRVGEPNARLKPAWLAERLGTDERDCWARSPARFATGWSKCTGRFTVRSAAALQRSSG